MGTVNVLTQMAEYDFNAPISVEMIFEDSDDDDVSFKNELSDQESFKDNNNNKQVAVEKNETTKNCTYSEKQINHEGLNNTMISLKRIEEIVEEIAVNNINNDQNNERRENTDDVGLTQRNQNIPDGNQHATILTGDDMVHHNAESVPVARRLDDHHGAATTSTFIEDLMNKLSQHIVLIMKAFYYYGAKTNEDVQKKEAAFNFIKFHFFELSYTTVESIFLPQERNETIINQFLDNTVSLANSQSLKWRCHRRTVKPFFNELMAWSKQKREFIRKNNRPCPSSENVMLKQQLVRPLAPLNLPQSEIVANYTNTESSQAQNNLCIFSSGSPGKEISINIDANTFLKINEKQKCGTAAQNANHNKTPNCKPTRGKKPTARYGNLVKHIQKKNPQYHRGPPPAYPSHNNQNTTNKLKQYIETNANNYNQVNVNRTYYNSMGQTHQNYQQTNPNYPTQVHYINTNQTTPPAYNDQLNYLNNLSYDNNTNYNIPMHGTQMENPVTCTPVITSVSSLNPNALRCCMCGKSTSRPCEPYYTPIYCSYLCQELDSQFYKRAWVNT